MEKFNFKSYIAEKADINQKKVIMTYGRFNPPTALGHGKVIQKVQEMAEKEGVKAHVLLSHSHNPEKNPDARKNPVEPQLKAAAIQHSFPEVHVATTSKEQPTLWHHMSNLYDKGVKDVTLVAGSDRVDEYKNLLEKYNNKKDAHGFYNINFKVVSAGQRDPDGETEEGGITSGTAARRAALSGDKEAFKAGVLGSDEHKEQMFKQINAPKRKVVAEDYENPYRFDWGTPEGTEYMMKMTPNMNITCNKGEVYSKEKGMCVSLREHYISNRIFKLGDKVKTIDEETGEIVYRGSNYVTIQLKEGTKKVWITDIQSIDLNEPAKKINEKVNVSYKNRFGDRQIPALLMSKKQLTEQNKKNSQLTYEGYTTEHLDMCPSAFNQLRTLINKNLNKKYVLQAIKATDQYLGIEKKAISDGFAKEETVHDFLMKLTIAHDTLNMLGFADKDLEYMKGHIDTMSRLSMHRDGTFANEPYSTIPMAHQGEVDEDVETSDYNIVVDKNGKLRKVHRKIEVDRTSSKDDREDSMQIKEQHPYVTTADQEKTHARDVNSSNEKEVFHGVDKTIDDQGHDNKPIGLVSFKSFMNDGTNKNIASTHEKDRQDVHRAQVQDFQQHSHAYKMMRKAHLQDN